jgi:hypothetical protein
MLILRLMSLCLRIRDVHSSLRCPPLLHRRASTGRRSALLDFLLLTLVVLLIVLAMLRVKVAVRVVVSLVLGWLRRLWGQVLLVVLVKKR